MSKPPRRKDYLKSIQTLNAAQSAKGSRLLQRRSANNGYDLLNLSLASMKLLAKGAQASLNDIYLALIIGAFQHYHNAFVESHYVLPPRPGCACMFAMISHQNSAGTALNYDPAAIHEPKLLLSCVSDEFAALCAHFGIELSR